MRLFDAMRSIILLVIIKLQSIFHNMCTEIDTSSRVNLVYILKYKIYVYIRSTITTEMMPVCVIYSSSWPSAPALVEWWGNVSKIKGQTNQCLDVGGH